MTTDSILNWWLYCDFESISREEESKLNIHFDFWFHVKRKRRLMIWNGSSLTKKCEQWSNKNNVIEPLWQFKSKVKYVEKDILFPFHFYFTMPKFVQTFWHHTRAQHIWIRNNVQMSISITLWAIKWHNELAAMKKLQFSKLFVCSQSLSYSGMSFHRNFDRSEKKTKNSILCSVLGHWKWDDNS